MAICVGSVDADDLNEYTAVLADAADHPTRAGTDSGKGPAISGSTQQVTVGLDYDVEEGDEFACGAESAAIFWFKPPGRQKVWPILPLDSSACAQGAVRARSGQEPRS